LVTVPIQNGVSTASQSTMRANVLLAERMYQEQIPPMPTASTATITEPMTVVMSALRPAALSKTAA